MKLINKSPRNYIAFDTVLKAGEVLDIQDTKIINILKTQPEVEEYVDKEDVKKLQEEIKELKKQQKGEDAKEGKKQSKSKK